MFLYLNNFQNLYKYNYLFYFYFRYPSNFPNCTKRHENLHDICKEESLEIEKAGEFGWMHANYCSFNVSISNGLLLKIGIENSEANSTLTINKAENDLNTRVFHIHQKSYFDVQGAIKMQYISFEA